MTERVEEDVTLWFFSLQVEFSGSSVSRSCEIWSSAFCMLHRSDGERDTRTHTKVIEKERETETDR